MRKRRLFVIGRPGRESVPWLALAGIVLLAAIPRWLEALRNPLSFEEIYIVFLTRLSLPHMLTTLAHDVEQPLPFVVLWCWRAIGGESEMWVKGSSIFFGLATIPAVFALARRDFGMRAGIVAAAILGANATHIFYSQYANMGTFEWLIVCLAFVAAREWEENPTPWRGVPLVLVLSASLFTYYFTVLPLTVLFVWGLVRGRVPRRRWAVAFLLALLAFLPELPVLVEQLVRDVINDRTMPAMPVRDLRSAAGLIADAHGAVLLGVFALALLPLASRRHRTEATLLWLAVAVPFAATWTLSHFGVRLFFAKQMLVALPMFVVLAGAGAASLRPRGLQALAAGAFLLMELHAWGQSRPMDEPADLARMQAVLAPQLRPDDLLLCAETHGVLDLQYHLPGRARYRLLVVPGAPEFHYGDGILAIPDSLRITPAQWAAERARGTRWWGLQVAHFPRYRDGDEAAALFAQQARVPARRAGKLTLWRGGDLPIP